MNKKSWLYPALLAVSINALIMLLIASAVYMLWPRDVPNKVAELYDRGALIGKQRSEIIGALGRPDMDDGEKGIWYLTGRHVDGFFLGQNPEYVVLYLKDDKVAKQELRGSPSGEQ